MKAGRIGFAVLGKHRKSSLVPSDGRNAPRSDKKVGIVFLSFLNSRAAILSLFHRRGIAQNCLSTLS